MIYVIATIRVAAERRDEFLEIFRANVPNVLAEKGCLDYAPTVDLPTEIPVQPPARDDVVTVVEKWENLEALEAHLVAPHMLEYRERVKDLVHETTIQVLEPA